ncbi:hypothetical protein PLESTB_000322400 [Pleodorina starrii]|uniref:Calcineurin-like phosphoesterase domain-containing protein n=1 Tax=Pleodorina starrii TaxID=330485 RepID=A0A9W6BDU1_9CHLO|nr:hypothetical protein PLESTB_000322400 [Pleodorina starrii]
MKTADRLREAQRKIEAISPPPAAVVFLGDVIHNGYVSKEFKWYEEHRNAYTVGGEIFGSFGLPVRYLWGNHDYHTTCGNASLSYDRFELSHRLFRHFLGDSAREFSAMKAGRYKLLFLNGMLGPSWEPTHPRCDTRQASLGERQLRWLAEELRGGEPAFVFLHHPLPATMRSEAPTLSHPDVLSLLLDHSNHIMAVFSGHYHRGLDWQDAYPFPHLTLPSCRYDSDNWFILQLPKAGEPRTWRLLDWDKNKGGARCSETWLYADPDPQGGSGSGSGSSGGKAGGGWLPRRQEPQPAEDGSCGSPSLERIDQVDLQPLEAADEVPGPAGRQFNPEPPCCLKYQQAFMDLCIREGPSKGCCAILGQHLRASSAAYGASCMCWPPFWQQAHQLFRNATRGADRNTTTQQQPPSPQQQQGQQQRQDIVTEVLERCVQNFGTQLQWPGRVGGSCLEPGSKQLPPAAAFA